MKVLIDTNVIIDVLSNRTPHFHFSSKIFELCGAQLQGHIAAYQTRDIFYLLKRSGVDISVAKSAIACLVGTLVSLDTNFSDIKCALASEISDFEDAILAYCAERHNIQFIITRNVKDFKLSPIKAVSPRDFVELLAGNE